VNTPSTQIASRRVGFLSCCALAAQVKTPVLIHWGANDQRVPLAHGRVWYRALRVHGATTRMIVYPGEGHVLEKPIHRQRRLDEDLAWFRKYLLAP